tara:strand:+ start:939 stop:1583 length:645 start_codon:yes stop_codon:yes gene_type:complete
MPWIRDGKCVYKKNKDGSRGEKEGCSDSIEKAKDYLKALYANTDDAPKKENKSMKMKKSELLALIKEEIMSEMYDGMMDDEYSHELPPEGVVDAGTREEMEQTDQIISMAYSLAGNGEAAKRLLQKCIGLVDNYEEARRSQYDDDMMYEGTLKEGFDPNDFMTMAKAIKQLLSDPYTGPMFAAIIGGLPVMAAYEKHVLGKMNKDQPPVDGGGM